MSYHKEFKENLPKNFKIIKIVTVHALRYFQSALHHCSVLMALQLPEGKHPTTKSLFPVTHMNQFLYNLDFRLQTSVSCMFPWVRSYARRAYSYQGLGLDRNHIYCN
jgi:hypothetical protein